MQIQHKTFKDGGAFLIEEGQKKLAEMTYQWKDEKTIVANHTWVDDSLRGQSVARKLLDTLVEFARENKLKIVPICSYVDAMFRRDLSLVDVIAK